jgi:hypothetical protein
VAVNSAGCAVWNAKTLLQSAFSLHRSGGGRMAIDLSDGNRRLVYWPFFIFGMLSPLASVGERWMPRYMADAFVFFVLFAVAAFAAARLSHPPQSTSIGKILLGSAAGAAVGGGLRYLLS